MSPDSHLRRCYECGQPWPADADHSLRSMGWVRGLPRNITPSNIDGIFHDNSSGVDRFLVVEIKGEKEQWPPQRGQFLLLMALARQPHTQVIVLRDLPSGLLLYKVSRTSEAWRINPEVTNRDDVNERIRRWFGASQAS